MIVGFRFKAFEADLMDKIKTLKSKFEKSNYVVKFIEDKDHEHTLKSLEFLRTYLNTSYFRRFVTTHYSMIDFNQKDQINEHVLKLSFKDFVKKNSTKGEKNGHKINHEAIQKDETYNPQSKKAKVTDNNKIMSFFGRKN